MSEETYLEIEIYVYGGANLLGCAAFLGRRGDGPRSNAEPGGQFVSIELGIVDEDMTNLAQVVREIFDVEDFLQCLAQASESGRFRIELGQSLRCRGSAAEWTGQPHRGEKLSWLVGTVPCLHTPGAQSIAASLPPACRHQVRMRHVLEAQHAGPEVDCTGPDPSEDLVDDSWEVVNSLRVD